MESSTSINTKNEGEYPPNVDGTKKPEQFLRQICNSYGKLFTMLNAFLVHNNKCNKEYSITNQILNSKKSLIDWLEKIEVAHLVTFTKHSRSKNIELYNCNYIGKNGEKCPFSVLCKFYINNNKICVSRAYLVHNHTIDYNF